MKNNSTASAMAIILALVLSANEFLDLLMSLLNYFFPPAYGEYLSPSSYAIITLFYLFFAFLFLAIAIGVYRKRAWAFTLGVFSVIAWAAWLLAFYAILLPTDANYPPIEKTIQLVTYLTPAAALLGMLLLEKNSLKN